MIRTSSCPDLWFGQLLAILNPMNAVSVEISTPGGMFFAGESSAVDLHTVDADIHIAHSEESYFTLMRVTEITLRRDSEFLSLALENATARLKPGQLIVLAENIQLIAQENKADGITAPGEDHRDTDAS